MEKERMKKEEVGRVNGRGEVREYWRVRTGGEMKMKRFGDLKCVGVGGYRIVQREQGGDWSGGN